MANSDAPTGFRPLIQGKKTPRITKCYHTSGDSVAIFTGDPVVKTGTASDDLDSTMIVAAAGATGVMTGVAVNYIAADTAGYVYIYDDPQQIFVIQDDESKTSAVTMIGSNASLTATAGHTTSGQSRYEINTTTEETTATLTVKIIGIDKRMDNVMGSHCDWLVQPNTATEADNTAGI